MSWRAIRWAMETGQQVRLTTVQRTVLWVLAYHHNDRTGACTPKVDTIAAAAGLSDRAVELATRALAETGLITVAVRTRHGIRTSNQYDLFGRAKGRTTFAPEGRTKRRSGGERGSPEPFKGAPEDETTNVVPFRRCGEDRR